MRIGFQAKLTNTIVKKKGATIDDIMNVILEVHEECLHQTKDYAKQFDFTTKRGFEKLWREIKTDIYYQPDEPGVEVVQSPNSLRTKLVGDCKSFTLLAGTALINAGIPVEYHLVDYGSNNEAHIYPVAFLDGEEIVMDSVYHFFNRRSPGEQNVKIYNPQTGQLISKYRRVAGFTSNNILPKGIAFAGGVSLVRQKNTFLQLLGAGLIYWSGKNTVY